MSEFSATLEDPTHFQVCAGFSAITVVVPVRNEEVHIAQTLDQLIHQDVSGLKMDILVIDGESTDRTAEIVKDYSEKYANIRLFTNPRKLSSAARNIAIKQSDNDYFVVIDGHCEIPNRRYFQDLVQAFADSGADCLGRPQPLEVSDATPLQRAIALARSSRLGHHPESFIYSDTPQFVPAKSVAIAYRREVFEKVGLFDEAFDAHEDGEFNYRCDQAGLKCYLVPMLTVKYFPRNSLAGLFKQMVRYGRGRVRFARKHPGNWGLGSLIPAALVSGLVLGPLLGAVLPALLPVYFACLIAYLFVTCGEALRLAIVCGDPWQFFRILPVFWAIHTGSGTGLMLELLGGRAAQRSSKHLHHFSTGSCVLVVAASPRYVGGQSVMAQRLVTDLTADGMNAEFLAVDPTLPKILRPLERVKYVRTFLRSIFYIGALLRRVPKCDVVHIFSASYSSFLVSPAPALLIARAYGKPSILNYHSGEAQDHLRRAGKMTKDLMHLATCIVVPSEYLRAIFADFGFASRVIPNHVDTSHIRFRERRATVPRILVSRMLEPLYNIECALRAFAIVVRQLPGAELVILGDGSQRQYLQQLCRELGLQNVAFAGRVERKDIVTHYDAAEIFLNTSSIDNMPVSIIEAFAAGLPVVTTDAGGIPYMVTDRENGHLVAVDDHVAVAQRVLELADKPAEMQRLSMVGKQEVAKYIWEAVGPEWKQLYFDVAVQMKSADQSPVLVGDKDV